MTDEAPEQEQTTEDQTADDLAGLSTPGVSAGGNVKLQTVGPIPTTFVTEDVTVGPAPTDVPFAKAAETMAKAKAALVKIKEVKEG